MTFQPPPPPPGGSPPPPPAGQWGPPGSGAPASFDPKSVNPLDWAIVGAGVLAFIFSFVDFYDGADVSSGVQSATVNSGALSAWHDVIGGGFFAWFAMLFAVLGAAAVAVALFAPQVRLPVSNRLAGLALFSVAALFEIIAIFVTPGDSGTIYARNFDVSLNHGFGFWISLIVIIAGLVLSLMRLQATGGELPGALGNMPNLGGYGPQDSARSGRPTPAPSPGAVPQPGAGTPTPQPGAGTPTPQPGYGTPTPPSPGYGPPQ